MIKSNQSKITKRSIEISRKEIIMCKVQTKIIAKLKSIIQPIPT